MHVSTIMMSVRPANYTHEGARASILRGTLYVCRRSIRVAVCACWYSCRFLGAELREPLLQLLRGLYPDLLRRSLLAWRRVSCRLETLVLSRPVVLVDSLFVLLPDLLGDTFHAEDLDVQSLTVGEGIFDV